MTYLPPSISMTNVDNHVHGKCSLLDDARCFNLIQKHRSGYLVTDPKERSQLLQLMSRASNEVQGRDAQIAALRSESSLEEERKELEVAISCSGALLAPIRMVPEDILREIFAYCPTTISGAFSKDRPPFPIEKRMLLFASHVCAHWRKVIHSSKASWGFVNLFMGTCSSHEAEVTDWILRATGNLLLKAKLRLVARNFAELDNNAISTLQHIFSRLEVIHCYSPSFKYIQYMENITFPSLQDLQLCLIRPLDVPQYAAFTMFRSAPSLKRLDLQLSNKDAPEHRNSRAIPVLPYHQIEDAQLFVRNESRLYEILSMSSNLLNLALNLPNEFSDNRMTIRPICLNKLQSLRISSYEENERIQAFFQSVTMKSLTSFDIYITPGAPPMLIDDFQKMLARSKCCLTSLGISIHNDTVNTISRVIPSILGLLPSVTYLKMSDPGSANCYAFSSLTVPSKTSPNDSSPLRYDLLLPHLERLDISVMSVPFNHNLLLSMLRSRCNHRSSLAGGNETPVLKRVKVVLRQMAKPGDDISEEYENFECLGMHVLMVYLNL